MRSVAAIVGVAVAIAVATAAQPAPASLPNLVPLPPEIEVGDADRGTGRRALRIGAAVANRGTAHLDLLGMPSSPTDERVPAHQCVGWTADRGCTPRRQVGDFVWHPAHGHHHFEGFALYELRHLKRDRPDLSRRGLAARGNKVSFCLVDYERDGEQGALDGTGLTGWPLYSSCVGGSGHQGISRGWRDVYTGSLQGQQIVIDDVEPGTYALVITIDPDERLLETNDVDNVVAVKVELGENSVTPVCAYSADLSRCGPPKDSRG